MARRFTIYNCHIHTFKKEDVPRRFVKFWLVALLGTSVGYSAVSWVLRRMNFLSRENKFRKYLKFVDTGKLPTQEAIFLQCASQYPKGTKFFIHAIDMEFMNAGRIPRAYKGQLEELEDLQKKYPEEVLPFIHIDPRRKGALELFKEALDKGFRGLKLYPPMGHAAGDERLDPFYEYCNQNKIPVLVHCGPQSPTHYRASKKKVWKMLDEAGISYDRRQSVMELCAEFGHPRYYIPILEKYPGLHICFAHWGSEISWENYIKNPLNQENWFYHIKHMLQKYPGLYTDISFTLNNREFFPVLKVFLQNPKIREKVLFCSDYYMVETRTAEKKFGFDLRAFLGEELFKTIAHDNPVKFLHGKT